MLQQNKKYVSYTSTFLYIQHSKHYFTINLNQQNLTNSKFNRVCISVLNRLQVNKFTSPFIQLRHAINWSPGMRGAANAQQKNCESVFYIQMMRQMPTLLILRLKFGQNSVQQRIYYITSKYNADKKNITQLSKTNITTLNDG